jgi:ADP-ribose pyrophosphatase
MLRAEESSMSPKHTKILKKKETLYAGRVFSVERHHVVELNGSRSTKDIVRHPGSAVILPVLDDGTIVLIRQFRVAINEEVWELPAGTRDGKETFLQTARRELREETGFRAAKWKKLVDYFPSPGFLNERMAIFVAGNLEAGSASPEEDEEICVKPVSMKRALGMIKDGQICDSKTLIGILYWQTFGKHSK